MIRMYDMNEDILVVRKSEYQNNNISDEYFVVPKEEWYCEDNGLKSFHPQIRNYAPNMIQKRKESASLVKGAQCIECHHKDI